MYYIRALIKHVCAYIHQVYVCVCVCVCVHARVSACVCMSACVCVHVCVVLHVTVGELRNTIVCIY